MIEGGFNLGKAKGKGYKVHATTITLSFPSSLVNSERDIYDTISFRSLIPSSITRTSFKSYSSQGIGAS